MISVIVPVYNVENYLGGCVDSILNSTYTDFELILVDDGSSDRSGAICDEYQGRDQRIAVIHQPNAGVSAARNVGLKASRGEFITFMDSDDMVHPRLLEVLWGAITSGDYDMSMVMHRKGKTSDLIKCLNADIDNLGSSKPELLTQQIFINRLFTSDPHSNYAGPCSKLYRRGLIFTQENTFLEFKPIHAEDTEWLIRVVLRMKQAVLKPLELYYYVMREDSLTHAQTEQGMNPVILGRLQTVQSFLNLFTKDMPQFRALCLNDLYKRLRLYSYLARGTSYEEETHLQCEKIYQETIQEYLHTSISPMEKMKNLLFYRVPWTYQFLIFMGNTIAKCKKR